MTVCRGKKPWCAQLYFHHDSYVSNYSKHVRNKTLLLLCISSSGNNQGAGGHLTTEAWHQDATGGVCLQLSCTLLESLIVFVTHSPHQARACVGISSALPGAPRWFGRTPGFRAWSVLGHCHKLLPRIIASACKYQRRA